MFDYKAPTNLLDNRIILVTGAGDGIGCCAAVTYAAHGATVILLGRTIAKLEKVYDEIESNACPQAAIYPLDLLGATEQHYQEMAQKIEQDFGRLDGLLHNAGILGFRGPIENYPAKLWNEVMQVNVNAPFLMTKALLPVLRNSNDASIIFTSSGVAHKGRAYWGAYATSKFAAEGLMQTLADELVNTSNIRVNSLNPGATRTQMRRQAFPGENPKDNPLPNDIMNSYLYLMGDDSRKMTGQSLHAQRPLEK